VKSWVDLQVAFASTKTKKVPFFDVATRHYLLKDVVQAAFGAGNDDGPP
jgi:hypothetical protein